MCKIPFEAGKQIGLMIRDYARVVVDRGKSPGSFINMSGTMTWRLLRAEALRR